METNTMTGEESLLVQQGAACCCRRDWVFIIAGEQFMELLAK